MGLNLLFGTSCNSDYNAAQEARVGERAWTDGEALAVTLSVVQRTRVDGVLLMA